jgi:heme exporter protein A
LQISASPSPRSDALLGLCVVTVFSGRGLACRRGERDVFLELGFRVEAGGALVLRGPNGSGKSSLLRCMAGLLSPIAGELAWDGRPIALDPEAHRARLHYVGHLDAIKPVLTVAENLRTWAALRGASTGAIGEALARLAIDGLARLPARLLSAGQRRRLALARLLVAPAQLWLLDEPTNALDDEGAARFAEIVADHRAKGGLVVLATHGAAAAGAPELDLSAYGQGAEPLP